VSDILAVLWIDNEDDVCETIKATVTLGFGVVIRNYWHPDPDGDGEVRAWQVTVLADSPHEDPDAEVATS